MGEKLRIGDNVTIIVSKIGAKCVQLAIDAPSEVPIAREELGAWDVCRKPNNAIEAASSSGGHHVSDTQWTDSDCAPPTPCDAPPGSEEKVAELARRVERGEALWSENDIHRRLKTSEDIAAWVARDLATHSDDRRTWKLKHDAIFTLPGRLVYVDRVGVVGSQIMLHDAEIDDWFSAEHVLEPLTSCVWQRIRAVINGQREYGREVRK
jgi:sRNA-binding carbon storage regulator CsrA